MYYNWGYQDHMPRIGRKYVYTIKLFCVSIPDEIIIKKVLSDMRG